MQMLYKYDVLEPYFKIAEAHAQLSPCTRRQYGAMIAYDNLEEGRVPLWVLETNSRQTRCCHDVCTRDRLQVLHGQRVEVGAEIHAETAALISQKGKGAAFILVGFSKSGPLYGTHVYPCHACAIAIKFAGYKYIYIRKDKDFVGAVSIAEIIEYREAEWEVDD